MSATASMIWEKELAALGFTPAEIGAIHWVLLRMGVLPRCEHTSPRFVECYSLEDVTLSDGRDINEARWLQFMQEMGFRSEAIALAESAIFGNGKVGAA